MDVFGYVLIGLGLLALVGGLAVTLAFEQQPQIAERYGTRFVRDASMFAVRVAGAAIILVGSVLVIVARHLATRG